MYNPKKILFQLWRRMLRRPDHLHYINGADTLPPPLSAAAEEAVFVRLEAGDPAARELLIVHNLRLVVYIARKFENSGVGIEDLISIGTIGLIKAVNTFCPSRNIKLATYSSRCIENEILMHLRSNKKNKRNVSLNDPIGADFDGNEIMILDVLGTDSDMVPKLVETNIESARALRLLRECLTKRERIVIVLRYGLSDGIYHPQHEVAKALHISRSYVSRIEKKAIEKLSARLG